MTDPRHRKPRFDPIGYVPKHREGVALKHKALTAVAKPLAAHNDITGAPVTRAALARQSAVKVAGAVGHTGLMLALRKSAEGHDAFEVTKAAPRHRGLGSVGQKAAAVDAHLRSRVAPKNPAKRKGLGAGAMLKTTHAGAAATEARKMDDALGWIAPVSPRQAVWWQAGDAAGHLMHHIVKSAEGHAAFGV